LFGTSIRTRASAPIQGPMHNSYLRLAHAAPGADILLKGVQDAPRIVNGVWRLEVDSATPASVSPLTLIPSYPDLPMEKVYPRDKGTGPAEVFMRKHGRGRVVYFPWDIDRTFWEVLCIDHGKIMANAIEWATNEAQPLTVSGPGLLDVTVWRQKESMTVHLVNLTNPMAMKGPFRELIRVGEQKLRVRLPDGVKSGKVRLLAADRAPKLVRSAHDLLITVPSVLDHEIVAIDLTG
jgi:hypothetical protein